MPSPGAESAAEALDAESALTEIRRAAGILLHQGHVVVRVAGVAKAGRRWTISGYLPD